MTGVYMSGSGNTKHCLEKLMKGLLSDPVMIPIEDPGAAAAIKADEEIFLAYPTHFSNIPYMVRDFINTHSGIWKGKKVFCLTTMALFAGDGTGCAARLLKKYGAVITGGLQVKMPDSIGDVKLLKKPLEANHKTVEETDLRLGRIARKMRATKTYPQEGLSFFAHLAGLFGQRLWFYNKTADYSNKLKVSDACAGCGLCTGLCPMGNLSVKDGRAVSAGRCAMCYRCINSCPQKALTLLGNKVYEQCSYEKYR